MKENEIKTLVDMIKDKYGDDTMTIMPIELLSKLFQERDKARAELARVREKTIDEVIGNIRQTVYASGATVQMASVLCETISAMKKGG